MQSDRVLNLKRRYPAVKPCDTCNGTMRLYRKHRQDDMGRRLFEGYFWECNTCGHTQSNRTDEP